MSIDMETLARIDAYVNNRVVFTSDLEQWHQEDRLEDALETGKEDCDGYMIAKLRLLLADGWPRAALKAGFGWVETGEYHAFATATLAGEDYVLDNRHGAPTRWQDCVQIQGYTFDKFYSLGTREWRKAGPGTAPTPYQH